MTMNETVKYNTYNTYLNFLKLRDGSWRVSATARDGNMAYITTVNTFIVERAREGNEYATQQLIDEILSRKYVTNKP